jgi:predicted transcriptional regulator
MLAIPQKKATRQYFRLERTLQAQLQALAAARQCPMSQLIREALRAFLATHDAKKKASM